MKLIFYKYDKENNRLNKVLDSSTAYTITMNFNREYDINKPTLRLVSEVDLSNFNYMQIDDKYYFIDKPTKYRTHYFLVNGTLDVLMTYKDIILKQIGTVYQSKDSLYLQSTTIPIDSRTKVKKYEFTSPFTENGTYVLLGLGYVAKG